MNKKLFFSMFAATGMLLATSCSNDELNAVQSEEKVQVTFSLGVEDGIGSRAAISDGTNINQLVYGVFDSEGNPLNVLEVNGEYRSQKVDEVNNITTTPHNISITLAKGQSYQVAFWAQNADCKAYNTENLKEVTVSYKNENNENAANNDDLRDAFFKTVPFEVNGNKTIDVVLQRPFAQINVGVTQEDWEAAIRSGIKVMESSVVIYNAATKINLLDGSVKEPVEVTYNFAKIPAQYDTPEALEVDVDGDGTLEKYKWLSMSYILVDDANKTDKDNDGTLGDAGATLEGLKYTFKPEQGKNQIEFSKGLAGAPVQRNWRTNIVGKILTGDIDFNITVDKKFENSNLYPSNQLQELQFAATFGGTVTLEKDVVLTSPLKVSSNLTINLNGKTISGQIAKGVGAVVDVAEGVNVEIVGGTIKNTTENGAAVIRNNGNLVLDGVKIEGAPIGTTGYPDYAVYAVGGSLVVEEGTEIVSDRGAIYLQAGADVTINGGEFAVTDAVGTRTLTAHVIYAKGSASKLTINGGEFAQNIANGGGTSVICPAGATIKIYGGNFYHAPVTDVQSGCFQNYMGYGAPVDVYGGTYNDDSVTKSGNLAAGYKAVVANGVYHILSEVVADAAAAANVTTVTESTSDVATALATDNGEATMFMWNDVAYIAKYGEVIITSAADEATTSRGVVESAAGLTSATVAKGIEVVGNRTFRKCANLETIALPNTLTEIGPAVFQSCSKLANVTIPASVTTIGEGAFDECVALTSINIPNGVTRLEKDVLRNTGLVSIEIPASVNYIGTYAFRDCESLTEVKILSPEFTIEANAFTNMAAPVPTMTIYVVNEEMKAYLYSTLTNYDKSYITVVVM